MKNFALNEDLPIAGGYGTPEGDIVLLIGDPDGTMTATFSAQALRRNLHHVHACRMPATLIVEAGAELRGFTIGKEPEPPQSVTAAPKPETTTMDAPAAALAAHDLLDRMTALAAVVAGRSGDVRTGLERASAGETGMLHSVAAELLGDAIRMQKMAEAASTIMAELRGSRG